MAWTASEELRIRAIESKLNDLQTALNNVPSMQQMKAILHIRQREVDDLRTRVAALESQVATLQSA